jgi:hypothetical protein
MGSLSRRSGSRHPARTGSFAHVVLRFETVVPEPPPLPPGLIRLEPEPREYGEGLVVSDPADWGLDASEIAIPPGL